MSCCIIRLLWDLFHSKRQFIRDNHISYTGRKDSKQVTNTLIASKNQGQDDPFYLKLAPFLHERDQYTNDSKRENWEAVCHYKQQTELLQQIASLMNITIETQL